MVVRLMPYKLLIHGQSDVGLVRHNNEDVWSGLFEDNFFVIADGMGGHQAGEVASREAISNLCLLFKQKFNSSPFPTLEKSQYLLFDIIQQVNEMIYRMGKSDPGLKGMGTTLCCILLHREGLVYAHVGDSRIYRLRQGKLEQLTQDHSLLRELIELGQIDEQNAQDFIYKNIITKAIGTESKVEPSVGVDSIAAGDVILMCTDGLSDLVSHKDIEKIMKETPIEETSERLIQAAKRKGGFDNITVVIVQIQAL